MSGRDSFPVNFPVRSKLLILLIVPLSLLFGWEAAAQAATHVQQALNNDTSGKTYSSFSATFGASTRSGNAIILGVTYGNVNPTITASDSQGNTYALAIRTYDFGHRQGCAILYAVNITGGAPTSVTVRFSSPVAYLALGVHEYSGVAASSALDATAGKTGSGSSPSSGPATTRANGDLIFACGVEDSTGRGVAFAPGSGFAKRVDLGNAAAYADQDQIQSSAGLVAATWTLSPAGDWIAAMAAFKTSGAGAGAAAIAAPNITGLSPASGPAGTSVTIAGSNFGASQGTSTVTFNGTLATPTSWSPSSIVVPVPGGATTGNVVVTVGGVPSNGASFTVTQSPPSTPSITGLSPASGPVGTFVTITGSNFGASQGTSTVTFNGALAAPTSWSTSSIVAPVPDGAATGDVVVSVGGIASNAMSFTVNVVDPATTPAFINGARQVMSNLGVGTTTLTGCNNNGGTLPYQFCLADPSFAGNAILAACTWSPTAGVAASMRDDKGQSYTPAFGTPPADGNQTIQIWYAVNSVPGAHQLSLNFSGGAPNSIQCGAYQVKNIAATSPNCGTTSASGNGSSVAAGSFTPAAANCFIFQLGIADSYHPSGNWTAGAGFTLQDVSTREGWAVQTLVNPAANAINPTLTMSSPNGWVTAAIALHSASSGSAPAGMYVRHIAQNALRDTVTRYTFQFPCSGNLVVVAFNGNTHESLNSVTGTNPASTYTQIGSGIFGVEGVQQIWQSPANIACTQNHTITINSSGPISDGDVMFYDVAGAAASSPSDSVLATDSGYQSPFGSPLPAASIAPNSNDGILFCTIGIALNGSNSFNLTGYQDNQDENNGWGHFHYTSTAALHTAWGTDQRQGAGGGVGYYSDACAAFRSASAQ